MVIAAVISRVNKLGKMQWSSLSKKTYLRYYNHWTHRSYTQSVEIEAVKRELDN